MWVPGSQSFLRRFLQTLEVVLALPLGLGSLFALAGGVPSLSLVSGPSQSLLSQHPGPRAAPQVGGFSSLFPSLKLELVLGLLLSRGVLSAAPPVSCGPRGDRRGVGEGSWD